MSNSTAKTMTPKSVTEAAEIAWRKELPMYDDPQRSKVEESQHSFVLGYVAGYEFAKSDSNPFTRDLLAAEIELNTALKSRLADLLEAAENALDDMKHYFENKCCPTIDEVNALNRAINEIKLTASTTAKTLGEGG